MKIKKQKAQKSVSQKENLKKFENYKNRLEATQRESKINHLEKNKIDIVSFAIKENIKNS